jgi:5-methylcytosine-specific restriction endonuclease McrA
MKRYDRAVYYLNNADDIRRKAREYYWANRALRLAAAAERRKALNPEEVRAYKRQWNAKNPEKLAAWLATQRAQKRNAMPAWVDRKAITAIYRECRTRGLGYEVDHIIPLINKSVCGLHVPWNLRVITAAENARKGNRWNGGDGMG